MSNREVVVVSGTRTGIGDYGGSLKDLPATRLGSIAIKEAVARAKIDPATIGHVVIGGVIHGVPTARPASIAATRDRYMSRASP